MNLISAFLTGQATFQLHHVTPSAQAVYNTIIRACNQLGWRKNYITTSLATLKRMAQLDKRARIRDYVNELIDCELIEIRRHESDNTKGVKLGDVLDFVLIERNAPIRKSKRTISSSIKQQQQQLTIAGAPSTADKAVTA